MPARGVALRKIAVIMGGRSGEHEVSVRSGIEVLKAVDRDRNTAFPVLLTRENLWKIWRAPFAGPDGFDPADPGVPEVSAGEAIRTLLDLGVECVFLALHGPYGEDGRVQGFLEMAGIPYTGSGVAASALCMDKVQSKRVMEACGILSPRWRLCSPAELLGSAGEINKIEGEFGYPIVVKTPCLGSSVGMSIPSGRQELLSSLKELADIEDRVLVEKYVTGRELTCAVLDGEEGPAPLPPTEIVPVASSFFDYTAKYTPGASQEITPARISPAQTKTLQGLALKLHLLMGCSGMSRSDFILAGDEFYALEVNTIPGMTAQSLLPQAAACAGLPFSEVVQRLVESAMRRAGAERKKSRG